MKAIVMGCGRVGSQVSLLLAAQGHDVTVIDHHDVDAESRLGPKFKGRMIHGLGFDESVLMKAGIKTADAFVAASSSDNANIVGARIAQFIYKVPRVVTRLFDPARAEIYERLGLRTVSTTAIGASQIFEIVTQTDFDVINSYGHGDVSIIKIPVDHHLEGKLVKEISIAGEVLVTMILRDERAFVPTLGTQLKYGDVAFISAQASAIDRLKSLLGE